MRYYRKQIFGGLSRITEAESLSDWEAAEMIADIAKALKGQLLGARERCKMEDGREQWMVGYQKFARIRAENHRLKEENAKLRESVMKLSS